MKWLLLLTVCLLAGCGAEHDGTGGDFFVTIRYLPQAEIQAIREAEVGRKLEKPYLGLAKREGDHCLISLVTLDEYAEFIDFYVAKSRVVYMSQYEKIPTSALNDPLWFLYLRMKGEELEHCENGAFHEEWE